MMKKILIIMVTLCCLIFSYIIGRVCYDVFLPSREASTEMVRDAATSIFLEELKARVLGDYVDDSYIGLVKNKLNLNERLELYKIIIQYSHLLRTSSEFAYIFQTEIIADDSDALHGHLDEYINSSEGKQLSVEQQQFLRVWVDMLQAQSK